MGKALKSNGEDEIWDKYGPKMLRHLNAWKKCTKAADRDAYVFTIYLDNKGLKYNVFIIAFFEFQLQLKRITKDLLNHDKMYR